MKFNEMMKKGLGKTIALGCAAALALTGCGSSSASEAESNAAEESAVESSAEESGADESSAEESSAEESSAGEAAAVSSGKSSHVDGGTDPIQIAYVLYDWSDDQGTYLESYLNYLAENMNITVECVSYTDSTEDLIDTVESLCSKGVDGICVASNDGFQSWAQICEDNGVYCSIMLGCLSDEDDREFAAGLEYYLGSLGTYDYSFLGEEYANFILEQGYQNVLIAAPSQGLQDQSDQTIAGALPVLDENGVNYELIQTAWGDLFPSVAAAVAGDSYDAIFCPLSMMNFGVPQIYSNNLVGQTVVMGHNVDESISEAMESGIVAMFSDNLTTSAGVNTALIINRVEGNEYPDWPAGECVNIQSPTLCVESAEDFEVYTQYIRNFDDVVYYLNVNAVEDMIMSYNGDATYTGIKDYIENLSMDNVAEQAK